MIRNLPVDAARLNLTSTGVVTASAEWVELSDGSRRPSGNQQKDKDTGAPIWIVDVLVLCEEDRPEVVGIQVATLDEPRVEALQPVLFDGLTVRVSKTRDGQLRSYWSADAVLSGKRSASVPASV